MNNKDICIGDKFGRLKVIEYAGRNYRNRKTWLCECECGNKKAISQDDLKSGRTNSCGCLRKEMMSEKSFKDLVGMKFGEWTVLELSGKNKYNERLWRCKCSCGNISEVTSRLLIGGYSKSCRDCAYKKRGENQKKHGMSRSRIYNIYNGIINRCYNKNNYSFKYYGERQIKVCDEWLGEHGFENFYQWSIKNGYSGALTIDRIDVNGNYEPGNCRWVDMKTQANNRRNNVNIIYNGKNQTLAQWSEELGINFYTLYARIEKNNWDVERAFATK